MIRMMTSYCMGDSERCSNKVAIHSSFVSGLFRDCLDRPGPGEDSAHRGLWRFFGLPPCKLTSSGDKVREAYIEFFRDKKEHDFIASSPVVPLNDPTLLFANAACPDRLAFAHRVGWMHVHVQTMTSCQPCTSASIKQSDFPAVVCSIPQLFKAIWGS